MSRSTVYGITPERELAKPHVIYKEGSGTIFYYPSNTFETSNREVRLQSLNDVRPPLLFACKDLKFNIPIVFIQALPEGSACRHLVKEDGTTDQSAAKVLASTIERFTNSDISLIRKLLDVYFVYIMSGEFQSQPKGDGTCWYDRVFQARLYQFSVQVLKDVRFGKLVLAEIDFSIFPAWETKTKVTPITVEEITALINIGSGYCIDSLLLRIAHHANRAYYTGDLPKFSGYRLSYSAEPKFWQCLKEQRAYLESPDRRMFEVPDHVSGITPPP